MRTFSVILYGALLLRTPLTVYLWSGLGNIGTSIDSTVSSGDEGRKRVNSAVLVLTTADECKPLNIYATFWSSYAPAVVTISEHYKRVKVSEGRWCSGGHHDAF